MGFSNNKWRKILTILMIINLCFILFAKFTKVFGAFTITNAINDQVFNIKDNFISSSPYYAFFTTANGQYIWVIRSNSPLYTNADNPDTFAFYTYYNKNNTGLTYFASDYVSVQETLNDDNFSTIPNESNQVTTNSFGAMKCFYTNHDIKNYSSGDIIINNNNIISPFFTNNTEIENGNPDGVFINAGDFTNTDTLYFHLLEITNGLANGDTSLYYYNDKIFALDKDSDFYRTWYDPSIEGFYYYIPRYKLGLSQNTSYLYVLNNSKTQIQNSNGVIEKDVSNGVFDVVESDTTGVITATEEENDRMKNIQSTIAENQETTNNINNSLTNTTVTNDTHTDINGSLNFNNQNQGLTNLNNGFFTRLTTMLSNLLGYNLAEDTSVNLPLPNSNKSLTLHSIDIYNNVTGAIRVIINAFWVYIFSFYMWKFINKIYIAISTGHILDTFSSSGEAITNNML